MDFVRNTSLKDILKDEAAIKKSFATIAEDLKLRPEIGITDIKIKAVKNEEFNNYKVDFEILRFEKVELRHYK